MHNAERYIARFAGVDYEPVEHRSIDHVKVKRIHVSRQHISIEERRISEQSRLRLIETQSTCMTSFSRKSSINMKSFAKFLVLGCLRDDASTRKSASTGSVVANVVCCLILRLRK